MKVFGRAADSMAHLGKQGLTFLLSFTLLFATVPQNVFAEQDQRLRHSSGSAGSAPTGPASSAAAAQQAAAGSSRRRRRRGAGAGPGLHAPCLDSGAIAATGSSHRAGNPDLLLVAQILAASTFPETSGRG